MPVLTSLTPLADFDEAAAGSTHRRLTITNGQATATSTLTGARTVEDLLNASTAQHRRARAINDAGTGHRHP